MDEMFYGHPYSYWMELERDLKKKNYVELVTEIVELRGKISYYEKRIDDMYKFMQLNVEVKV